MDTVLPIGSYTLPPGPLERFLPPVERGVIRRLLELYLAGSTRLLDPFGVSPRVALECAQAGHELLVASNNPVTRFVLRHTLKPLQIGELQAALAHMAGISKDGTRLEPFIMELYRSHCARCGEAVEVEFYVWDKELGGPSHKVYACEQCGNAGESAASEADWDQALDYSRRTLQHALALEQVAPAGDPDRKHAEAALSVYPGRAIFALITILNKLEQEPVPAALRAAAEALLLHAFDACNALWSYPEGRLRPRQLISSARFREYNVWLALEQAVDLWAQPDPGVRLLEWGQDGQLSAGGVRLYPGSARDLCQEIGRLDAVDAIVSVPPRPNQAYWTLSALWTAWLWGREAAAPIKVALQRRRYDWAWHASALRTVFSRVAQVYPQGRPAVIYVPEAEPGFVAATLSGTEAAGFKLLGSALRQDQEQFLSHWQHSSPPPAPILDGRTQKLRGVLLSTLEQRAESTSYAVLHAAAWTELAGAALIERDWSNALRHPVQTLTDEFERLLRQPPVLHVTRGSEPESGLYLLQPASVGQPLSDRVERTMLEMLRERAEVAADRIDQEICRRFPGLQTPDRRWVSTCLESYAEPVEEDGRWKLRREDRPDLRQSDRQDIARLLQELGGRLGFEVRVDDWIRWELPDGQELYRFDIRETSAWGHPAHATAADRTLFVVPGSRSGLVAERARRDPEFRTWLEGGVRVLKFRHVRRLIAETTLTRDNFAARLAIDPPEHQDPQLPLL